LAKSTLETIWGFVTFVLNLAKKPAGELGRERRQIDPTLGTRDAGAGRVIAAQN
jgi:hypothetical protein